MENKKFVIHKGYILLFGIAGIIGAILRDDYNAGFNSMYLSIIILITMMVEWVGNAVGPKIARWVNE